MTQLALKQPIVDAARWLADQKEPPPLAVPVLKERFGLKASEACEAILIARGIRSARRTKSRQE